MIAITSLNAIRKCRPCADGWKKLLAHLGVKRPNAKPLSFSTILESNGLDDALWCLRAVEGIDRECRLYAVACARRVQHLMTDPRSVAALDVAERYANGQANDAELDAERVAALDAAWDAALDAASDAARVAARVAASDAASDAARVAAWDAALDAASDAAWVAARVAASDAAWDAASDAAWDAEREWQRRFFVQMFCAEGDSNDQK